MNATSLNDVGRANGERSNQRLAEELIERSRRSGFVDRGQVRKYLLLSTPRVGSTLLTKRLKETKLLGEPDEWFTPPLVDAVLNTLGTKTLDTDQYFQMVLNATVGESRIFGLNLHVHQYVNLLKTGVDLMNIGFERIYWLRRRDKIKQAYSWCKAHTTQCFSKDDEVAAGFPEGLDVELTPAQVADFLRMICSDSEYYEREFKTKHKVDREFFYLDIVADNCQEAVNGILADFGFPPYELAPRLPMKAQTRDFEKEQIIRLKQYFGCLS